MLQIISSSNRQDFITLVCELTEGFATGDSCGAVARVGSSILLWPYVKVSLSKTEPRARRIAAVSIAARACKWVNVTNSVKHFETVEGVKIKNEVHLLFFGHTRMQMPLKVDPE